MFALQDHAQLMAGIPLVYQIHTLSAWAILALWPFSRLVHAWSIPFQYIGRPYILYRRRYTPPGLRTRIPEPQASPVPAPEIDGTRQRQQVCGKTPSRSAA